MNPQGSCVPWRTIALAALLAIASVPVAGCDAVPRTPMPTGPPERAPDISGAVVFIALQSDPREGYLGSVEVSGTSGAYDRAFVSVPSGVGVFLVHPGSSAPAAKADLADIRVGDELDVWFTGPVAESYPVQATAEAIALLRP